MSEYDDDVYTVNDISDATEPRPTIRYTGYEPDTLTRVWEV